MTSPFLFGLPKNSNTQPVARFVSVAENLNRLADTLRAQSEHARHAEDTVVGRDNRAPNAGLEELIQRCVVDHAGRHGDLSDTAEICQLLKSGIEVRVGTQLAIVIVHLSVGNSSPEPARDQPTLRIDFV